MPRPPAVDTNAAADVASRIPPLPLNAVMLDGLVLAFDFGARRTGVAIANSVTRAARALTIIDSDSNEARWVAIGALFDEWQPVQCVVGIPRHPDGAADEMTARCERFARQLEGRFGRPVARVDERYTSALTAGDDGEAAALILQQWLAQDDGDA